MGFSNGGEFDDVLNDAYVSARVTIGNAYETLAKVGTNPLEGRETITITNVGNKTVYFGPSGFSSSNATDGEPLRRKQTVTISAGYSVGIYLRCANNNSTDVIIQEWA